MLRTYSKPLLTAVEPLKGFGNVILSEVLPGAVPRSQNSPQKPPYGLYPELLSGSAFTLTRAHNKFTWLYRCRPSVAASPGVRMMLYEGNPLFHNELDKTSYYPIQYRSRPLVLGGGSVDFIDGIRTMAIAGSGPDSFDGCSASIFSTNLAMNTRAFQNNDAETLLLPYGPDSSLEVKTEMGTLVASTLEMIIVPRGVCFSVSPIGSSSQGYMLENFGSPLNIPDKGVIGISSGLANPRHFEAPHASFEDLSGPFEIVVKSCGKLFRFNSDHSPFNVVGWQGNNIPWKYDTRLFMAINTVSYDHPDPSIGCVMHSASAVSGVSNLDFVIFPPRWVAATNTFRPPWFHRNIMSEFMGLLEGQYDAKDEGFSVGCCSIHNCMVPHGPDSKSVELGTNIDTTTPQKYEDTMAFMWETRHVWKPTIFFNDLMDKEYVRGWNAIKSRFTQSDSTASLPHPIPFQ